MRLLCTASVLFALAVPAAAQQAPAKALGAEESAALQAAGRAELEAQRAAAFGEAVGLEAGERTLLRDVELRNPDLEALRAGDLDLTDREVKIILITAGIIIVLALIL